MCLDVSGSGIARAPEQSSKDGCVGECGGATAVMRAAQTEAQHPGGINWTEEQDEEGYKRQGDESRGIEESLFCVSSERPSGTRSFMTTCRGSRRLGARTANCGVPHVMPLSHAPALLGSAAGVWGMGQVARQQNRLLHLNVTSASLSRAFAVQL